jgi:hypothetical protein
MTEAKLNDYLKTYITAKNELMQFFNCDDDFFIKAFNGSRWMIKNDDDFSFLMYWTADKKRHDAVIVKKNGSPMVYKAGKYTMVIAIDCVKIAFIFENEKFDGTE